jgi:hypothetical protein
MDEADRENYAIRALLLTECQNAFEEPGNLLFVWMALNYCSDRYWPRTEVPAWRADCLFDASNKLADLVYSEITPFQIQVLAAFGLSPQRGKNLFRNARSAMRKIRAAKNYNVAARRPGAADRSKRDRARASFALQPSGSMTNGSARGLIRPGAMFQPPGPSADILPSAGASGTGALGPVLQRRPLVIAAWETADSDSRRR